MIIEYPEKERTRKLYEEAFDDPKEFVDYYYSDKCLDNRMIVSFEGGEVVSMLHLNPFSVNLCGTVDRCGQANVMIGLGLLKLLGTLGDVGQLP